MKKVVLFCGGILFAFVILGFGRLFIFNRGEMSDSFTKGVRLSNGDILLICFEKKPAAKHPWGFMCVLNIKNEIKLVAKTMFPKAFLQEAVFQFEISRSRDEVVMYTGDAGSGLRYKVSSDVFHETPGYRLSRTNVLGHVLYVSGAGRRDKIPASGND